MIALNHKLFTNSLITLNQRSKSINNYIKLDAMKKILVPIDFSKNAIDALSYAIDFEKDQKVKFFILHAVTPVLVQSPQGATVSAIMTQNLVDEAKVKMKDLKNKMVKIFSANNESQFEIKTMVQIGNASREILEQVKELEIDLLIMGTKGAGHDNLDRIFGTISSSMLNDVKCPMILVPKGYIFKEIDNVIFSTDLDKSDSFELWKGYKVLSPHNPMIRVLHVKKQKDKQDEKQLKAFADHLIDSSPAIKTQFNIEIGDRPEEYIEKYAISHHAEMILMPKRRKNIFQRLLNPSRTKKVLNTLTSIPIMILN